ncbi:hypothetical protein [Nocardia tengchongensis]|uniref:hypothetical protein n=1 Tax=Nocardia tengchongensis TaxID=2055889 RepID=UPI00365CDCA2
MPNSVEARFEKVARTARRVQDAVERVRARAVVDQVRIEVAADGRITALALPDAVMAQSVSTAHERARIRALERAAALRRELSDDAAVADAVRRLLGAASEASNICVPQNISDAGCADAPNPYALPCAIRRRYGMD